jgi:palmitoyl transferase
MRRETRHRIGMAAFVLLLARGTDACAFDCTATWLEQFCSQFNDAMQHGATDSYLPFYAYHGRGTFTRQELATINEHTWGAGVGRSTFDSAGDWHGFYAMGFSDSSYRPELLAGYGYQTYWGSPDAPQVGLGYAAFVTVRRDFDHYLLPVPALLPMASVRLERFSVMATYLPRISAGEGDILFLFARLSF